MAAIDPAPVLVTEAPTAPPLTPDVRGRRVLPLLRSVVRVGVHPLCDVLALLSLIEVQLDGTLATGLAAASVAVLLVLPPTPRRLLRGKGPTGRGVLPRSALAVVIAVQQPVSAVWIAAAVVCTAVQLEPVAVKLARAAVPVAANLPGLRARNAGPVAVGRLYVVNTGVVLVVTAAAAAGRGFGLALAAAVCAVVLTVAVCADAAFRVRARRSVDPRLHDALQSLAPRFAVHWDATPGTEYQLSMWLPHLDRVGEPFVVVVRNPATFRSVAALTTAPVLLRRDPADLDAVVVGSLGTVFYVNNAARNTHFVRFPGLEHVQLGHGDSDKAPSFSPVFRMYTRAFVSGPAAVERFAHNGVLVPAELFTVVGRPQVAGMLVGASTSGRPTALYAPTWAGANADSNHSSLPIGVPIVQALLTHGYQVLFRPHPYTRRSAALAEQADRIDELLARDVQRTGRTHLGSGATAELSLYSCFDAAHLLVSDVSSVVADFLHSEKPYLLTSMSAEPCAPEERPLVAAGGYEVGRDTGGLEEAIDLAGGSDPLLAARRGVKTRVLGDHGGADPAEVFVGHARRVVLEPSEHRRVVHDG